VIPKFENPPGSETNNSNNPSHIYLLGDLLGDMWEMCEQKSGGKLSIKRVRKRHPSRLGTVLDLLVKGNQHSLVGDMWEMPAESKKY